MTLGNRQGRSLLVAEDWLPMTALGFYKTMDDLGYHALSGYMVPSAALRCSTCPCQTLVGFTLLNLSAKHTSFLYKLPGFRCFNSRKQPVTRAYPLELRTPFCGWMAGRAGSWHWAGAQGTAQWRTWRSAASQWLAWTGAGDPWLCGGQLWRHQLQSFSVGLAT